METQELSYELIKEAHEDAALMGFHDLQSKPGYDQIGQKGQAYVIDRGTRECEVIPCKIVDRDGRPWIRPRYPHGGRSSDYLLIGWKP